MANSTERTAKHRAKQLALRTAQAKRVEELERVVRLLEGLCVWMLYRFGHKSPEGKEAEFRLLAARQALEGSAKP